MNNAIAANKNGANLDDLSTAGSFDWISNLTSASKKSESSWHSSNNEPSSIALLIIVAKASYETLFVVILTSNTIKSAFSCNASNEISLSSITTEFLDNIDWIASTNNSPSVELYCTVIFDTETLKFNVIIDGVVGSGTVVAGSGMVVVGTDAVVVGSGVVTSGVVGSSVVWHDATNYKIIHTTYE